MHCVQCAAGAGPALPRDKNNLINLHPNEWNGRVRCWCRVLGVWLIALIVTISFYVYTCHSTLYPGPAAMVSVQDIQFSGINI